MRNSHPIKNLFSAENLSKIRKRANLQFGTQAGDKEFLAFQRQVLQALFAGFEFDFATLSSVGVNERFEVEGVSAVCLDLPDNSPDKYQGVAHLDGMSPLAYYVNAGRTFAYTDAPSHEQRRDDPFFLKHGLPHDIHQSMMVCFMFPGFRHTFIAFEYLGSADNKTWQAFDHSQLELGTFPFLLGWLYRRRLIDNAELEFRFMALEDLTENQLIRLRKYVNSPGQSLREQADELSVSEHTFKRTLYDIRDKVAPRFDWGNDHAAGDRRQFLRSMEADYAFMRLLGDPTRPMNVKLLN